MYNTKKKKPIHRLLKTINETGWCCTQSVLYAYYIVVVVVVVVVVTDRINIWDLPASLYMRRSTPAFPALSALPYHSLL